VASLASIPFVAAKCGETKDEEEKKPEVDKKPGEGKEPGQNTDQGKNPETNASPKEETKTDISKLDEKTKKELSKQLKGEFSENPSYDNIVKELQKHFKGLNKKHILVQGSKDKLKITATGVGSNPFRGTLLLSKM
ncbi:variable surface lipoprotein, partial [Acinetobacter baumannii]|uniref:variable surface lipoprotein n=1 Tax=Acinetobacter baumannii TaxID=470 RepID=UPI001D01C2F1